MAILKLEDGMLLTDLKEIAHELAPLNIQINHWSVGDDPQLQRLLAQDSLNEDEKEQVLKALDNYFEELKQTVGYHSRDLIVLHPGVPNLDGLMAKFDQIHTHADDEVRYIIDGEGVFGFERPDGTEHWFYLTKLQRIKAVRYFIGTEGWVPQYTNKEIRLRQPAIY